MAPDEERRVLQGCCRTCGFLSRRAKTLAQTGWRPHSGFHETENADRDHPERYFDFVPGETNALQKGELVCFRRAADLPHEMEEASAAGASAAEVVWRDRRCVRWIAYEPGISPRDHLAELKTRDLEEGRREFQRSMTRHEERQAARERRADRRLTKAAIWLGSIVGLAQLLTMSPDSIGYRWLVALGQWLWGLRR